MAAAATPETFHLGRATASVDRFSVVSSLTSLPDVCPESVASLALPSYVGKATPRPLAAFPKDGIIHPLPGSAAGQYQVIV